MYLHVPGPGPLPVALPVHAERVAAAVIIIIVMLPFKQPQLCIYTNVPFTYLQCMAAGLGPDGKQLLPALMCYNLVPY